MSTEHWYKQQQRQPKVRSACDACHERKIRCQTSASGSSCQACHISGRKCFFLPCSRAGRPRRPPPPDRNISDPGKSNLILRDHEPPTTEMSIIEEQPLDLTSSSLPDFQGNLDWAELTNHETMNFFNEDYAFVGQDADSLQSPFLSSMDGWQDGMVEDSAYASSSTTSIEGQPTQHYAKGEEESSMMAFANLAQMCTDLHGVYESFKSTGVPVLSPTWSSGTQIQYMLQKLDTAGDTIIAAIGTHSGHQYEAPASISALPTLIVAALLKLLDICNVVTQRSGLKLQSLDQVRLLKRIDFNIMQVRTALMRLGAANPPLKTLTESIQIGACRMHGDVIKAMQDLPQELGCLS